MVSVGIPMSAKLRWKIKESAKRLFLSTSWNVCLSNYIQNQHIPRFYETTAFSFPFHTVSRRRTSTVLLSTRVILVKSARHQTCQRWVIVFLVVIGCDAKGFTDVAENVSLNRVHHWSFCVAELSELSLQSWTFTRTSMGLQDVLIGKIEEFHSSKRDSQQGTEKFWKYVRLVLVIPKSYDVISRPPSSFSAKKRNRASRFPKFFRLSHFFATRNGEWRRHQDSLGDITNYFCNTVDC